MPGAPEYSFFERMAEQAGPWAAGAAVIAAILIVFIRYGLIPLLAAKEVAAKDLRTFEENQSVGRHSREMEIEEMREKQAALSAQAAIATKDGLANALKIQETTSSTAAILERMLQSVLRERRERSHKGMPNGS